MCPTCFLVLVHANGTGLRRLPVLQTVVDVGRLPAGILPVLDVLEGEGGEMLSGAFETRFQPQGTDPWRTDPWAEQGSLFWRAEHGPVMVGQHVEKWSLTLL